MRYDTASIIANNKLSDTVARYVDLRRNGPEYEGLCPFHKEKSPSFTVSDDKGFYHCFGCGAHGDVIDFVRDINGTDFLGACEILGGVRQHGERERVAIVSEKKQDDAFVGIVSVPNAPELKPGDKIRVWAPKRNQWSTIQPSMVFRYPGDTGYVVRIEGKDGKKITPMIRWVSVKGGEQCWAYMAFESQRPMYGAQLLDGYKGQVVVVEGEKAADAAGRMLGMPALTWAGGAQAHKRTDFSALKGRHVILWPDADAEGVLAMEKIAERIYDVALQVKIVRPESERPKGWDVADAEKEGWDKKSTIEWLRKNTYVYEKAPLAEPAGEVEEYPEDYSVRTDLPSLPDYPPETADAGYNTEQPFRILGHNEGSYYFLPSRGGQIVELSATGLANIANLFRLAMADYWKSQWGVGDKASFGSIARYAASALIDQSERIGIFKPKYIRGVGAWMDNGTPVIHRGSTLLIEHDVVSPRDYKSRFVYPVREATYPDLPEPLSSKEAVKLREICGKISWESKLSGELLAGWIVTAPVCGALNWRSHIWVEGQSETGKSTVLGQIVEPMMPGIAVRYDGGTTEAAIRQDMGVDALPIIYDEAEPENIKDRIIMDGLLLLARKSSTGAKISKGSAGGRADNYVMRSAFCFAGINPAIKQRADESRISRLVIKKATFEGADEFFRELKKEIRETLTKDYALRMIARTISNLPTLLANIDTFADACADVLGSRRAADQISPMLAGLYLLTSTKRIDYDTAHAWIQNHDWTLHTAVAEQSDPERLIMHISTAVVRTHTGREMTIGSLISRALGMHESAGVKDTEALSFLRDMGIWPRRNGILFSNKSPRLEKILAETPWVSWSRPLSDVPGATKQNAVQYTTGLKERGVLVPLEAFGLTYQQQEIDYE